MKKSFERTDYSHSGDDIPERRKPHGNIVSYRIMTTNKKEENVSRETFSSFITYDWQIFI